MNIQKVAGILKKRKMLYVIRDKDDMQWIGDGRAFYQLEGIPEMTAASLLRIMGVDELYKWSAVGMQWPVGLHFCGESMPVKHAFVPMKHHGDDYMPIVYENEEERSEIIWILAAYMKPLEKMEDVKGYVRMLPSGDRCIVFKSGLFPVAFVGEDRLCRDEAFVTGLRMVSILSVEQHNHIVDKEKAGEMENETFDFGEKKMLEVLEDGVKDE